MSYTVDANVLLYASDETSDLHRPATSLVERMALGPELVYLFWPTVMAYLRIATHPAIFGRPLSALEAVSNIEQLLARAHVRSPGEGEGFWGRYREVVEDIAPTGNLVPDAQVVALMLEHDVRTIWTRDRDYRTFRGIEVIDPFAEGAAGNLG